MEIGDFLVTLFLLVMTHYITARFTRSTDIISTTIRIIWVQTKKVVSACYNISQYRNQDDYNRTNN